MSVTDFTIYGERCSGTNWLQQSIETSMNIPVTWRFGWKHFPGHNSLEASSDCLFLCIVRNPYDWLASLFQSPHHLAMHLRCDFSTFLTDEFYSWYDEQGHIQEKKFGTEIMADRHIKENRRYRNILELRNVKNSFFLESLPRKVKNHYVVSYDLMKIEHAAVLEDISQQFDLPIRSNTGLNSFDAKRGGTYQHRDYLIQDHHLNIINNGLDWRLEEILGFSKKSIVDLTRE